MQRRLMQLGFVLIVLALLTGLVVPQLANPRLGLAAHTVGTLGGLLLVVLGASSSAFRLTPSSHRLMNACWIFATYANWFASLLGGLTGASRRTPIAGAGTAAGPIAEGVVEVLLITLSLAALLGGALAIRGLSGSTPTTQRA
jgi:(hydroxyamino)benzene mutase